MLEGQERSHLVQVEMQTILDWVATALDQAVVSFGRQVEQQEMTNILLHQLLHQVRVAELAVAAVHVTCRWGHSCLHG